MLQIKDLTFGYKKNEPVLKNISLSLSPGITLLVGENGSGKSTLMHCLTGMLHGSGEITLEGVPCGSVDYARMLSYLPQRFDVYPTLKVREILRFVAELKGVAKDNVLTETERVAQQANVSPFLNTVFKKCSEGMQRRVGIAAALLGDPKLVVLDEPTAGVDPQERFRFYQSIKTCFTGKIVLISTHILDDIESLASTVVMLTKGQIACDLPYEAFVHSLGREATMNELWSYYQEHTNGTVQ